MIDFANQRPRRDRRRDELPVLHVSGLVLHDPTSQEPVAVFSVKTQDGMPSLTLMRPSTGQPALSVGLAGDTGEPCVVLLDKQGTARLMISLARDGQPMLLSFNERGEFVVPVTEERNKP